MNTPVNPSFRDVLQIQQSPTTHKLFKIKIQPIFIFIYGRNINSTCNINLNKSLDIITRIKGITIHSSDSNMKQMY